MRTALMGIVFLASIFALSLASDANAADSGPTPMASAAPAPATPAPAVPVAPASPSVSTAPVAPPSEPAPPPVSAPAIVKAPPLPAEIHWEIAAGSGVFLARDISGGGNSSEIQVTTTIDYILQPSWEVGITANYEYQGQDSSGTSLNTVSGLAGATFNFAGTALQDAFLISGQVGILYVSNLNGATANVSVLQYEASFGKRFPLGRHVMWRPEIAYIHTNGATNNGSDLLNAGDSYTFTPFKFSLVF